MFEIFIEQSVIGRTKDLYIFEKVMDKEVYYCGVKDGKLVSKPFVVGETSAEPFLSLPYKIADVLFKAIADAFNGLELKTDEDIRIKGTLDATRDHLKDLQKLLKLI